MLLFTLSGLLGFMKTKGENFQISHVRTFVRQRARNPVYLMEISTFTTMETGDRGKCDPETGHCDNYLHH